MSRPLAILAATALLLGACGGASPTLEPATEVRIVASTTVLADLVRRVAGDRASVHALVPAGTDVHTFDAAPSDALRVGEADLLVMNGLGLDDWLAEFARQSGASETPLLRLAEDLPGVEYLEGGDDHADDHGEEDGEDEGEGNSGDDEHGYNPHLWLDPDHAAQYVERIADGLAQIDADGEPTYRANAAGYAADLAELDAWIADQLSDLPADARRLVTFHDAFAYFARAYGLEIVGVLVEVAGQEPSAQEVAQLIEQIRASGARLVLAESQFNDTLAQTVARETDATVVRLYSDALGDPPADTYAGAMRWNVEQIVEALP